MKTTGIIRRIDAGVIITPKPKKRINTRIFADFCPTKFAQIGGSLQTLSKKRDFALHIKPIAEMRFAFRKSKTRQRTSPCRETITPFRLLHLCLV
jgi:hypothetical protein